MRESRCTTLLLLLLTFLFGVQITNGQATTSLQPGTPVERTLAAGQVHNYNITLEQDQFLELIVDQRGIDVVIHVFSPTGRRLGEFDTPNGPDGPEDVTVIADASGVYRIEVAPLDGYQNPSGRYEIKIVELRKATEQELQGGKNQEALKAKGLALLTEIMQTLEQVRRPQTRALYQLQAAQLLWDADEKRATKLTEQAIESVKEYIAGIENSDVDYYESFNIAMQLRNQVVEALAPHDPEMALNFLRATRTLANPEGKIARVQGNQELMLELSLASQIAANDPKRAFQIAEESLKTGTSTGLIDTLNRLHLKDQQLAAKLADDIATKLINEPLLRNFEAAYLASSFLQFVRRAGRRQPGGGDSTASTSLVSEDKYRDLIQKILAEVLSYSGPSMNMFTPERSAAQNLINTLKQLGPDLQSAAPDRAAAFEKKWLELNNQSGPQSAQLQTYQNAINSGTPDAALESAAQAPREMREQLYQQIANKVASTGDIARARQIINDHVTNPSQRQNSLKNLDQQAIHVLIAKGKADEALKLLSNYRPASERAQILSQIVMQIGPGLKRATALLFLQQARSMLGPAGQAGDQQEMFALLAIGRAFSRYDANRAFDIVEPLVDQFNEISSSALTMDGFGQKYYQDGEVIMTNGNVLAEITRQLAPTLSSLAMTNFDRARTLAAGIHPVDIRVQILLAIAQQTLQPAPGVDPR